MRRITFITALTVFVFIYAWTSWAPATEAKKLHRQKRSAKVAGGSIASITEFPYAVQLILSRGDGSFLCGGSIIRPNIVLTAAHCVKRLPDTLSGNSIDNTDSDMLGITVIAGESQCNGFGLTSQRRQVTKIRRHPHFNNVTLINDLAVLLLGVSFDLDGMFVSQVALPLGPWQSFSGKAQICGWGSVTDRLDDSNKYLRKAELSIRRDSICDSYYTSFEGSTELCAGGHGPGKACPGDSGGPLICHGQTHPYVNSQSHSHSRSQPYLCGVTSSGDGCKPGAAPGVYVRVSAFVPWIEAQIQELRGQEQSQPSPPSYPHHPPFVSYNPPPAPPPPPPGGPSYAYSPPSHSHAIRHWFELSSSFIFLVLSTNFLLNFVASP